MLDELSTYEVAYLAAGPLRVAEVALATLSERGAVTFRARVSRVRAVPGPWDGHPVERALVELCPTSSSVWEVLLEVADGDEVEEIGDRLLAEGLLGRTRKRPTAAGRRAVEDARRAGRHPAVVFDGLSLSPRYSAPPRESGGVPGELRVRSWWMDIGIESLGGSGGSEGGGGGRGD